MKKLELKVEWKTNEYYEVDTLTLLLTDDKIAAIQKAQQFLKENRDIDTIRVRVDQDCLATMTDYKLGYGFVIVGGGDALYFIGTDHSDSQYQVETESFELEPDDGIPEEDPAPENFSMVEIMDFKDAWGQTHDEICDCLGFDVETSDDLLTDDYFWLEEDKKWYPKSATAFTEREENIADYLRV